MSRGWEALLSSANLPYPEAFITMNFNRQASKERMVDAAKAFFARLDRRFLGRNYCRRRDSRADMIGVIEKPTTHPHIHWKGICPTGSKLYSETELTAELTTMFKVVVSSGTIDFRRVWDNRQLSSYMSKELFLPERSDRVLFTRDFWPAD